MTSFAVNDMIEAHAQGLVCRRCKNHDSAKTLRRREVCLSASNGTTLCGRSVWACAQSHLGKLERRAIAAGVRQWRNGTRVRLCGQGM